MTLERKKNHLGYSKANCEWATMTKQARNRRGNRMVTFNGKTQTLAEWAEDLGLVYGTLSARINKYGWPLDRALTPIKR